jgi:phospholipase/carboxylesterase
MAETLPLSFIHRFEKGAEPNARPLLLLHGTGGDENDLIPLGRMIAPAAPLLSPRGKVLENGMPRFFRRFAEGRFDEDDVRHRAQELADFIEQARTHYGIALPIALGYSNGANIAAALLLLRPQTLAGAILLRATLPLSQTTPVDLTGKPVLIDSGASDPRKAPRDWRHACGNMVLVSSTAPCRTAMSCRRQTLRLRKPGCGPTRSQGPNKELRHYGELTGETSGENARLWFEHCLRHRRDLVFRAAGRLIAGILAGLCRRLDARSYDARVRGRHRSHCVFTGRPFDAAALKGQ